MSPKIVDKAARRQAIAEAALDVLATKGFAEASITAVAEAAGIGKGTVYEYFDSKDELLFAALVTWSESKAFELSTPMDAAMSPEERLRAFVRAGMATFLDDPRAIRVFIGLMQLQVTNETFFQRFPVVEEMSRQYRETLVKILRDGATQGRFRAAVFDDAERIAINLLGYCDGIGMHYFLSRNYFDLIAQVEFHLDALIAELRATGE